MPTDATVEQSPVIQQLVNVDVNAVNQIAQLNIRQRVNGMNDDMMQLERLLEVRPQYVADQYELEDKKLADFLSGDGNVCLIESNSGTENFPDLDSEELDKILNSLESSGSSDETIMEDETTMEDTFVPDEEQNPMMSMAASMPALGYAVHADGIDTGTLRLYSPSPHLTSLQPPAAIQTPVSPTGVTGNLLQQLTIDNSTCVEMAVSGSNRPIQLIHYTPIQVGHFCLVFSILCTCSVCHHHNHINTAPCAEL